MPASQPLGAAACALVGGVEPAPMQLDVCALNTSQQDLSVSFELSVV
jgi:hypothetical protein